METLINNGQWVIRDNPFSKKTELHIWCGDTLIAMLNVNNFDSYEEMLQVAKLIADVPVMLHEIAKSKMQ
jgi:hypothetical protein